MERNDRKLSVIIFHNTEQIYIARMIKNLFSNLPISLNIWLISKSNFFEGKKNKCYLEWLKFYKKANLTIFLLYDPFSAYRWFISIEKLLATTEEGNYGTFNQLNRKALCIYQEGPIPDDQNEENENKRFFFVNKNAQEFANFLIKLCDGKVFPDFVKSFYSPKYMEIWDKTIIEICADLEKIESTKISMLPLRIFISHVWGNFELYRWLKDILDHEILWLDMSIPIDKKINLFNTHREAREQIRELQEKHLKRLKIKLQEVKNLTKDHKKIQNLETEIKWVIEEKRKLENSGIRNYTYEIDPFYDVGKISRQNVLNSPNLSLAIRDRILDSDLMIIISGPYDQHREWMQFECYAARGEDMPVISIISPDHETIPIEMKHFANWIIRWDPATIKHTILQAKEKILNNMLKTKSYE